MLYDSTLKDTVSLKSVCVTNVCTVSLGIGMNMTLKDQVYISPHLSL